MFHYERECEGWGWRSYGFHEKIDRGKYKFIMTPEIRPSILVTLSIIDLPADLRALFLLYYNPDSLPRSLTISISFLIIKNGYWIMQVRQKAWPQGKNLAAGRE